MTKLDWLYIVGSVASILGVLYWLGIRAKRLREKFRKDREEIELQLASEIELYREAGRSPGARRDLGFVLLNEVQRYRSVGIEYLVRFYGYLVMSTIMICSAVILIRYGDESPRLLSLPGVLFAVSFVFLALTFMHLLAMMKYDDLENHVNETISQVWKKRVEDLKDGKLDPLLDRSAVDTDANAISSDEKRIE